MNLDLQARALTGASSRNFILLLAFLTAVLLMGGSSLDDIASLAVLRPLSVLMVAFGLATLDLDGLRRFSPFAAILFAGVALAVLQIIPLPPSLWHSLSGRDLLIEIDAYISGTSQWRPLSIDPAATRDSLFSLFTPIATFLLAIGISAKERRSALFFVGALGLLSACLGILQITFGQDSGLYLYRKSVDGTAQGFFANRNHQALLLAVSMPILFAWAHCNSSAKKLRIAGVALEPSKVSAWMAAIFLAFTLLVVGSRSGLLFGAIAGIGLAAFSSSWNSVNVSSESATSVKGARLTNAFFWLILAGLTIALVTLYFGRAEAITRILATNVSDEGRLRILPTVLALAKGYMPFGSGFGTFQQLFQVYEPDSLLKPTIVNRAHNDWLEFIITGGAFAWLILVAFEVLILRNFLRLMASDRDTSQSKGVGLVALLTILIFALASLVEYPLRMPSLQCIFVLVTMVFLDEAMGAGRQIEPFEQKIASETP